MTERSKRVLHRAQDELLRVGGNGYVSTEHLLLAILGEPRDSLCIALLESLSIDIKALRSHIESQPKQCPDGNIPRESTLTPRAKRVIDLAYDEARIANQIAQGGISPVHILLGLIREGDGVAGKSLAEFGATLEAARAIVTKETSVGFVSQFQIVGLDMANAQYQNQALKILQTNSQLIASFKELAEAAERARDAMNKAS